MSDWSKTWPERLEEMAAASESPRRVEMRRTADAVRRILHGLVNTEADLEQLTALARELDGLADRVGAIPNHGMYEGFAESANSGDPRAFVDHSPMLGQANPLAPPISLDVVDGHIEAVATFGSAYEGPPGCVHGGYIAAAFDEVLGATQSLSGAQGMTGRLVVHYRKPTPLRTELRFVGRLGLVDGRKINTTGQLYAGETLTAEAEALFISIDIALFAALREARDGLDGG